LVFAVDGGLKGETGKRVVKLRGGEIFFFMFTNGIIAPPPPYGGCSL